MHTTHILNTTVKEDHYSTGLGNWSIDELLYPARPIININITIHKPLLVEQRQTRRIRRINEITRTHLYLFNDPLPPFNRVSCRALILSYRGRLPRRVKRVRTIMPVRDLSHLHILHPHRIRTHYRVLPQIHYHVPHPMHPLRPSYRLHL